MDFWELVADARAEVGHTVEWPSGMQVGGVLTRMLRRRPREEILGFGRWADVEARRAERWEIGAASFLISGYLSDDGFTEFRYGLIALGRDDFEAVLADPDTGLATLPLVRAMAAGHASHFTIHGEHIQYAAAEAYGDHYLDVADPAKPHALLIPDLLAVPVHLPRLYTLFPRPLDDEDQ